jgi:glycosyltransferase involved in cell wall biosynthesis
MKHKSILFITKSKHAPSTRYRATAYFNLLRSTGWHPMQIAAKKNPLARLRLLYSASKADVVVILRKTFSGSFFHLLRLCSSRIVLDLDDAIFCRSNGTYSTTRWNRFTRIASRCQQIWAGNEYLADIAGKYNSSVIILPTSLSIEKYTQYLKKPTQYLDLVWIGSNSTRKYLETGLPMLERIADSFPRMRLKIVADFDLPSRRLHTVTVPWSEEKESEALSSAHIGIAPMPNNSWTKGKCGLKILQYMAAGLPVVSSPAGVNGEIVKHGVTGFLAESPEAWLRAIEKLAQDPDLRHVMGKAGQKRVTNCYSIDFTYQKMLRALDMLYLNRPLLP